MSLEVRGLFWLGSTQLRLARIMRTGAAVNRAYIYAHRLGRPDDGGASPWLGHQRQLVRWPLGSTGSADQVQMRWAAFLGLALAFTGKLGPRPHLANSPLFLFLAALLSLSLLSPLSLRASPLASFSQ